MKILNRMKLKNKRRKISCYVLKRKKCVTNETYKKKNYNSSYLLQDCILEIPLPAPCKLESKL